MAMESWRMAAYCHEGVQQFDTSWRCGQRALEAAARLAPDARRTSTLPFVGQGLLRLLPPRDTERAAAVRERMTALAGPDWELHLTLEHATL